MRARLLQFPSRLLSHAPERTAEQAPGWSRDQLAGRLTELSGQGATSPLTTAASLILDAQRAGEPCAWVTRRESTFFPPDLALRGIDLEALAVVFVSSPQEAARATARLAGSGGFGLVAADLGRSPDLPLALLSRLSGLALQHDTAIVLLTEKPPPEPSVGPLISLRVEPRRARLGEGHFRVRLEVLKDKRHGPGWTHEEVDRGPAGLR